MPNWQATYGKYLGQGYVKSEQVVGPLDTASHSDYINKSPQAPPLALAASLQATRRALVKARAQQEKLDRDRRRINAGLAMKARDAILTRR